MTAAEAGKLTGSGAFSLEPTQIGKNGIQTGLERETGDLRPGCAILAGEANAPRRSLGIEVEDHPDLAICSSHRETPPQA